jgi:hypothetical protein
MLDFLNSNVILFIILVFLMLWVSALSFVLLSYLRNKKKVIKGIKNKGLENILETLSKKTDKTEQDISQLYKISDQLGKTVNQSITKIGVVRYNPFDNTGGDQSFSIAMLNLQNSGLVISSLHGREGNRMYSKPIEKGKSPYRLSKEEQGAIKKALQSN